jgi:hypothetical protein
MVHPNWLARVTVGGNVSIIKLFDEHVEVFGLAVTVTLDSYLIRLFAT